MLWLTVIFGAVVGLSLGLTGGGGALFAVPMLVYGLGLPPREAVGISLAAVGTTALLGFVQAWRQEMADVRTGIVFAVAGMLGAPLGALVAGWLPEGLLMLLFAAMMLAIAARMWRHGSRPALAAVGVEGPPMDDDATCQRDSAGALVWSSRCALLLICVGFVTGVLSGMFGISGGFVIVPALVFFSGMSLPRAVGTSLMVIALVAVSGVSSHLAAGQPISLGLTALFVAGGTGGLFVGQAWGRRLPLPLLQRGFAVVILAVALFVIARNVLC